jgi:hypothetical protein
MAGAAKKTLKPVEDLHYEDGFKIKSITLRGTTYKFREVDGQVYDDCVENSTSEIDDQGRRTTDWAMVNKFLLERSLVDPKMPLKTISALPYGVRQAMFIVINELHPPFTTEGREEKKDDQSA